MIQDYEHRRTRVAAAAQAGLIAWRWKFLIVVVMLAWIGLVIKLVWIQGIKHSVFVEKAEDQYLEELDVAGIRGTILDCNGQILAIDLPHYYAVGAVPSRLLKDKTSLSSLANVLGFRASYLQKRLKPSSPFVWVDRGVDEPRALRIKGMELPGVRVAREPKRIYPYGALAGQVIGATDCDRVGINGVEHYCNATLRDEPRKVECWTDARRAVRVAVNDQQVVSRRNDVWLTIDIVAQTIVDEELASAVETHRAECGVAIMTEPRTGRILAISTYPPFDPNSPENTRTEYQRCRPITDMYEPGSTYKLIVTAAALESGMSPERTFFCEYGQVVFGKRIFRDAHPHGTLTFRNVFAQSSNIGMAKIGYEVGPNLLYKTARDFGFGQPSGIAMEGEARGVVHLPSRWSGSTLSNFCIGQGVLVTPLQLAMAYGAIANGGDLLRPQIFQSRSGVDIQPIKIRRAISPRACQTLKEFMVEAVKSGTGKAAAMKSITVAGKTGTAQKVDFVHNVYYQNKFVSSFVGFVPAEDPKYLALVILDDPKGLHYGSQVAAPAFKNIMTRWMAAESSTGTVFVYHDTSDATSDSTAKKDKDDSHHRHNANAINDSPNVMPELVGIPIRSAVKTLTKRGLDVSVTGMGLVKSQEPKPGTAIEPGTRCQLIGETT